MGKKKEKEMRFVFAHQIDSYTRREKKRRSTRNLSDKEVAICSNFIIGLLSTATRHFYMVS
jgi:hypothetical protein